MTPYTSTFSSFPAAYSTDEGPDIIPRLSPTQVRPHSYFNDESSSYQTASHAPVPSRHAYSQSASAYASHSSTALASLRDLAAALPRTNIPTSTVDSSPEALSRTSSGVWNYIPFAGKTTPPSPPTNSFGNPSTYNTTYNTTSTYTAGAYGSYTTSQSGNGRSREDLYSYGKNLGMDRPLPPRSGPGNYGHRPKSIDLVTPYPRAL